MAIRVIEGVPGSGKTYYALHHLLSNYFRWDDTADWWTPKKKDTVLLSNIDGLRLGVSLPEAIEKAGGLKKFFNYARMREWLGDRRAIIVIDEAQNLFDRRFYDKDVFYFFQMHRHLGVDIYLITQDVETLAKELRALSEYRVQAARRVLSLTGEFRYRFVTGDGFKTEAFKTKMLVKDQKVFAVYKSMQAEEGEKIGSASGRMVVYAVVILLVAGACVGIWRYTFAKDRVHGKGKLGARAMIESPAASSPAAVGASDERPRTPDHQGNVSVPARTPEREPMAPVAAGNRGISVPDPRPVPRWAFIGLRRFDGMMELNGEEVFFVTGGLAPFSLSRDEFLRGARVNPDGLRLGQMFAWYTLDEGTEESRAASEAIRIAWAASGSTAVGGRENGSGLSGASSGFLVNPNSESREATHGIASTATSFMPRSGL